MKKQFLFLGAVGLACISLIAPSCKNPQPLSIDPQMHGEGVAMVQITAAANSPFKLIARSAMLTISAKDMLTMTDSLTVTDSSVTGTIPGIPAGKNRMFQVAVFDSLETIQYKGQANANVIADSMVRVTITIYRVGGGAVINGTINEGQSPADSGPIANWTFDSTSGNTYYDVTGHGYTALSTGTGLSIVAGLRGQALNLSGKTYEIAVRNSSENFNLNNFSIETWFYLNTDPAVGIDNASHLFNFQYVASGIRNGYSLYIKTNGVADFSMASKDGSSYTELYSQTIFKQKTWYHIVATYDLKNLKVYVNGILDGSAAHPGGYAAPHANAHIGELTLQDGTISYSLDAKLDEMKFFGYAMPPDSVLAHYNALKPN